jgi:hypothetical protein
MHREQRHAALVEALANNSTLESSLFSTVMKSPGVEELLQSRILAE